MYFIKPLDRSSDSSQSTNVTESCDIMLQSHQHYICAKCSLTLALNYGVTKKTENM